MLTINLKSGRRLVVEKASDPELPLEPKSVLSIITTPSAPFEGNETATREELAKIADCAAEAGNYVGALYFRPVGGLVLGRANPAANGKLSPDCVALCIAQKRALSTESTFVAMAEDTITALNQYLSGCVFEARVESPAGFEAHTDDAISDLFAWSETDVLPFASYELDLTEDEAEEARAYAGY